MTESIVIISFVVGTILSEISIRTFRSIWLSDCISKIFACLHEFYVANGDDARQELLLKVGHITLKFSLMMMILLILMVCIATLAPWVLQWTELKLQLYFLLSSISAIVWWLFRNRINAEETSNATPALYGKSYNFLEKLLHWIALDFSLVRIATFKLERKFFLNQRDDLEVSLDADQSDGAVYVCGLARSGTTILLRIFDEIDIFCSLKYRDMPFVLAPNLWSLVARYDSRKLFSVERSHGDGIYVDSNSPESFEEVFWKTFNNWQPYTDCLTSEAPSTEVLSLFSDYRAMVVNRRFDQLSSSNNLSRYLSKNNNNLLRLGSLCEDPAATVLIVYRNPVSTARSLHRQHQRFCDIQRGDFFTRRYMAWLGHHEFGLDHLPFCFALSQMDSKLNPEDLDYWLDYWSAVYQFVLSQDGLRFSLVNHDLLRAEPNGTLSSLFGNMGIKADTELLSKLIKAPTSDIENIDGFSQELLSKAEVIHQNLLISTKNILSN